MEIRIRFEGGPIDGEVARSDSLQDVKVFFPTGERSVLIYRRDPLRDELTYYFDLEMSMRANDKYDETVAYFSKESPSIVAWEDPPESEIEE